MDERTKRDILETVIEEMNEEMNEVLDAFAELKETIAGYVNDDDDFDIDDVVNKMDKVDNKEESIGAILERLDIAIMNKGLDLFDALIVDIVVNRNDSPTKLVSVFSYKDTGSRYRYTAIQDIADVINRILCNKRWIALIGNWHASPIRHVINGIAYEHIRFKKQQ